MPLESDRKVRRRRVAAAGLARPAALRKHHHALTHDEFDANKAKILGASPE